MSVLEDILAFLGLLAKRTPLAIRSAIQYDLGLITVSIPWPIQDWTVYEFKMDNVLFSAEQAGLSQSPKDFAANITERLNAIYTGADVSNSAATIAGRAGALVTGTLPNPPALDPGQAAASLRISVAIIPVGDVATPMVTKLTAVSQATDPDPWPAVLTNLENATSGGGVASGLTRQSLAGLSLDLPSTYAPPSVYRFGMSNSLAIVFDFDSQQAPALDPKDVIWFDPSVEQVTSEITSNAQSISVATLQATIDRWLVSRQAIADGTTIEKWAVWKLVLD